MSAYWFRVNAAVTDFRSLVEAIKKDCLFEELERELEEARAYYEKNVDPSVRAQTGYFDQAVVDILVKGQGSVESKIW